MNYFGKQIIDEKTAAGEINRQLLKKILFKNEQHREWIEKLLHPLIKEKMIEKCNQLKDYNVILLVIPLLFEAKFEDICTEIWLVDCSKEVQTERLIKRDKISKKEADQIINLQMDVEKKRKLSDIILKNEDGKNQWKNKIQDLI